MYRKRKRRGKVELHDSECEMRSFLTLLFQKTQMRRKERRGLLDLELSIKPKIRVVKETKVRSSTQQAPATGVMLPDSRHLIASIE